MFANKKIENKIVEKPCKIRKSLCKHFCKQYKVGIRANFFIYSNVNGGYFVTEEVKGATPGNQHWVAVTGEIALIHKIINHFTLTRKICKMLEKTWGKIILMVCLNRRCD